MSFFSEDSPSVVYEAQCDLVKVDGVALQGDECDGDLIGGEPSKSKRGTLFIFSSSETNFFARFVVSEEETAVAVEKANELDSSKSSKEDLELASECGANSKVANNMNEKHDKIDMEVEDSIEKGEDKHGNDSMDLSADLSGINKKCELEMRDANGREAEGGLPKANFALVVASASAGAGASADGNTSIENTENTENTESIDKIDNIANMETKETVQEQEKILASTKTLTKMKTKTLWDLDLTEDTEDVHILHHPSGDASKCLVQLAKSGAYVNM